MWATQPQFTAEQLRGITVPTWIVDADHDEAIKRENTLIMAAHIPNAGLFLQPAVSATFPSCKTPNSSQGRPAFPAARKGAVMYQLASDMLPATALLSLYRQRFDRNFKLGHYHGLLRLRRLIAGRGCTRRVRRRGAQIFGFRVPSPTSRASRPSKRFQNRWMEWDWYR